VADYASYPLSTEQATNRVPLAQHLPGLQLSGVPRHSPPNDTSRISGGARVRRDVAGNDGFSANDGVVANRDAFEDHGLLGDPDVIPDPHTPGEVKPHSGFDIDDRVDVACPHAADREQAILADLDGHAGLVHVEIHPSIAGKAVANLQAAVVGHVHGKACVNCQYISDDNSAIIAASEVQAGGENVVSRVD